MTIEQIEKRRLKAKVRRKIKALKEHLIELKATKTSNTFTLLRIINENNDLLIDLEDSLKTI